MRIVITGNGYQQDITEYVQSTTWSGDYRQCARTLELEVVHHAAAQAVRAELGNRITLWNDTGSVLFEGYIFRREKNTGGATMSLFCFDRGIYLNRNEAVYKYTNRTAAEITRTVCADFGIEVGTLPEEAVTISRNFLGCTLYNIIQTCWNLTGNATGKSYLIRFDGDRLNVLDDAGSIPLIIAAGTNMMELNVSESIENMVNRVNIYNKEDMLLRSVGNDDLTALYGLMQAYLKQNDDEDVTDEANKLLEEGGVTQRITVENLGNETLITGQSVILEEPMSGLYGRFWIETDVHTWKLGQYYNKLTLNFRRMVDDVKAGEEVE